jgi:membrane fusion protein, multidrug efflux system
MSPLQVKFTLPERFFTSIKQGSQVQLNAADSGSITYTAKVVQVSPVIDPSSGTMEILAELTGSTPELRPGMLVNIKLKRP